MVAWQLAIQLAYGGCFMSSRKGNWGPYEFTRAAYDELHTSERSYRVRWALAFGTTSQRGVWAINIKVLDAREGAQPVPVVRYQVEWPNARAESFEACLYGSCHRVARMVEQWALQWGAEAARAVGG